MNTLPVHSKLGASQMHRWEICPGSVRLSQGIEGTTSIYAAEGTVAHARAAHWLEFNQAPVVGNAYECEGYLIGVTAEMVDAIQVYITAIDNDRLKSPHSVMQVEQRFHLKDVHADLYGTADCVLYSSSDKLLRVYDYKHGAGVPVEVKDNPQLLYYGLGALLAMGVPADTVEIVVVQPRCYHPDGPVRRQSMPAVDLLDFSAELLAAVHRTEAPDAALVPGEHCRWCKASPICPQLKDQAMIVAKNEFSVISTYDATALSKSLVWLPIIEAWCENVRKFAYGEAQHGRCPPGFKLVEKVGRRSWVDEHVAGTELKKLGLTETELYGERELLSPAQIEKKLSTAHKPMVDLLAATRPSGSTLVPETDRRPALKTDAATEFAAIQITEATDDN